MSSAGLVAELVKDETGPWVTYGRSGKPINQRQVANLLAEFHIHPKNMRVAGIAGVPKGYAKESFTDAFERYLSAHDSPSRGATPPQPNDVNDLEQNRSATSRDDVADRNSRNLLKAQDGSDVADRGPLKPKLEDRACAQCRGPLDGKERCYEVSGRKVWLHPECYRFFVRVMP
jgi:hypothetical protein